MLRGLTVLTNGQTDRESFCLYEEFFFWQKYLEFNLYDFSVNIFAHFYDINNACKKISSM